VVRGAGPVGHPREGGRAPRLQAPRERPRRDPGLRLHRPEPHTRPARRRLPTPPGRGAPGRQAPHPQRDAGRGPRPGRGRAARGYGGAAPPPRPPRRAPAGPTRAPPPPPPQGGPGGWVGGGGARGPPPPPRLREPPAPARRFAHPDRRRRGEPAAPRPRAAPP